MRGLGNLGGLGSMGNIMKQAQKAMEQAQHIEAELAATRIEGSAGGGMVRVEATGNGQFDSVRIDRQAIDPNDAEMLEDLVLSAFRDAADKAAKLREERMKELTSGLGLPGAGGLGGMFG